MPLKEMNNNDKECFKIIDEIDNLRKTKLWAYFNMPKFLKSVAFHEIAVIAANHCKNHDDITYIIKILEFSDYKSTKYLTALRWFEYRINMHLYFESGKLKVNHQSQLHDENYQIFGEFMQTYKGELPKTKLPRNILNSPIKKTKDKLDLIATPMRAGGRAVSGGYGTGKRK